MATTVGGLHGTYAPPATETKAVSLDFAWHAYAVVLAATMVVVGLLWDISWHMSIGRDTFWTPAHLLIQGGGLIAGLGSGALALYLTFRASDEERASTVSFWGFRAPFGAWVCVLGCGAMLTSAPFDDWWHDAYGLDVRIVSPPHVLLGFGMLGIILGALLRTLALANRPSSEERVRSARLFTWCTGLFVTIISVLLMEWTDRTQMHSASFYIAVSLAMPVILVAAAAAERVKWPATTAAAVYMAVLLGTSWILMLFPATPKLGPIYRDITHYVPLDFPVLLVIPAIAIDLVWKRVRDWPRWRAAAALGTAFFLTLTAVQWPFANFLMDYGRNWFFHTDNFVYWQSVPMERISFQFRTHDPDGTPLLLGMLYGLVFAIIASAIGIVRGHWMTRVQR
jgi:hypothetical protein